MGFGSYDESEQENKPNASEINVSGEQSLAEHDGDVEFEHEQDTDELLDQLQDMKADSSTDE